jgi:hypothetical protein
MYILPGILSREQASFQWQKVAFQTIPNDNEVVPGVNPRQVRGCLFMAGWSTSDGVRVLPGHTMPNRDILDAFFTTDWNNLVRLCGGTLPGNADPAGWDQLDQHQPKKRSRGNMHQLTGRYRFDLPVIEPWPASLKLTQAQALLQGLDRVFPGQQPAVRRGSPEATANDEDEDFDDVNANWDGKFAELTSIEALQQVLRQYAYDVIRSVPEGHHNAGRLLNVDVTDGQLSLFMKTNLRGIVIAAKLEIVDASEIGRKVADKMFLETAKPVQGLKNARYPRMYAEWIYSFAKADRLKAKQALTSILRQFVWGPSALSDRLWKSSSNNHGVTRNRQAVGHFSENSSLPWIWATRQIGVGKLGTADEPTELQDPPLAEESQEWALVLDQPTIPMPHVEEGRLATPATDFGRAISLRLSTAPESLAHMRQFVDGFETVAESISARRRWNAGPASAEVGGSQLNPGGQRIRERSSSLELPRDIVSPLPAQRGTLSLSQRNSRLPSHQNSSPLRSHRSSSPLRSHRNSSLLPSRRISQLPSQSSRPIQLPSRSNVLERQDDTLSSANDRHRSLADDLQGRIPTMPPPSQLPGTSQLRPRPRPRKIVKTSGDGPTSAQHLFLGTEPSLLSQPPRIPGPSQPKPQASPTQVVAASESEVPSPIRHIDFRAMASSSAQRRSQVPNFLPPSSSHGPSTPFLPVQQEIVNRVTVTGQMPIKDEEGDLPELQDDGQSSDIEILPARSRSISILRQPGIISRREINPGDLSSSDLDSDPPRGVKHRTSGKEEADDKSASDSENLSSSVSDDSSSSDSGDSPSSVSNLSKRGPPRGVKRRR